MATGEGKTLVATLPAYLHALKGAGVHILTTNDYLARRDAQRLTAWGCVHACLLVPNHVLYHVLRCVLHHVLRCVLRYV